MNEIPIINPQSVNIIPAIEPPVVQETPSPVIRGLALPIFRMPDPRIDYPVINVPTQEEFDAAVRAEKQKEQEQKEEKTRELPDTKPIIPQVQVPQDIQNNQGVLEQPSANLGVPVIEVPIIGEVPVPPKEQVILAGTTATASVAAALVGKSVVEWMVNKMKPVVQQIFVRGKKLLSRDLTPYELQIYFAFEKSQSLKKVNKLLKKEQKKDKQKQYKEFHEK
ncbi:hypothetical protein [Synechococcus phage DSL-LC02]|nr:hypothetical protein [Synechococcus phage DSL-LC02]